MSEKRCETKQGIELNFGVNHLGHFVLVGCLLDLLAKSKPSRLVVVSSIAHRYVKNTQNCDQDLFEEKLQHFFIFLTSGFCLKAV